MTTAIWVKIWNSNTNTLHGRPEYKMWTLKILRYVIEEAKNFSGSLDHHRAPLARLDTAYMCTEIDNSSFSHLWDGWEP